MPSGAKYSRGGPAGVDAAAAYSSPLPPIAPLTSAAQSISFAGLASQTDGGYEAVFYVMHAAGADRLYRLLINGSTNLITYLRNFGGTSTGGDGNQLELCLINTGGAGKFRILVGPKINGVRFFEVFISTTGAINKFVMHEVGIWASSAEVTDIGLQATAANGIGIGSFGEIWRVPFTPR